MRNTMDNVIDYFNFEGYLKLLEQKTGEKMVTLFKSITQR